MPQTKSQEIPPPVSPVEVSQAIRHLEQEIIKGKHWYLALLEAIGLWEITEETYNRRAYNYLIAGEAFDLMLLAERICQAVDGLLPENEKVNLLFHGQPPLELKEKEFKAIIGESKYHQYLNFFYGITVEEALIPAVEDEIRKERRIFGFYKEKDITNEVYRRIYSATRAILLRRFRREQKYPQLKSINLTELKEFTYWLFKYRLANSDKARVASDTKKSLDWLKSKGYNKRMEKYNFESDIMSPVSSEVPY